MNEINQLVNTIIEEIKCPKPNVSRILNNLYGLRTKEEYQSLSDSEFYDIVGKTFISNPEYFTKKVYSRLISTFWGKVNGNEMDKYIIEHFCLYAGERILYESAGKIKQANPKNDVKSSVEGKFYVTNYRIIALGTLTASGGRAWTGSLLDLVIAPVTGGSKRNKSKTAILEGSTSQKLPCYGYQFKIKNLSGLKKKKNYIKYFVLLSEFENLTEAPTPKELEKLVRIINITLPYKKEALSLKLNTLYEILCQDKNQILLQIRELHAKGIPIIPDFIKILRINEEYKQITDVEYLDIVRETYNLNPEHFMKSIYPEMKSWKLSSFLKIKNELFEILRKEGANIQ